MSSKPDETYDDFLAREASGFVVAVVAHERGPMENLFVNVVADKDGKPFETQADARRYAARTRSQYRREVARGNNSSTLVKVSVRPLWKAEA